VTAARSIRRVSPPQAVQKLREDFYLVQILLSEPPGADWKRFFYEGQPNPPADFPPRSVDISGTVLRFRSDSGSVAQKIRLLDQWIERANQKTAGGPVRSEEERRRREALLQEQQELAMLNERWSHL
jgi:hypothetical protein